MTFPSCHNLEFKWVKCVKASFEVEIRPKGEISGWLLPEVEVSQPVFHQTREHPLKGDSVARHSDGAQAILT